MSDYSDVAAYMKNEDFLRAIASADGNFPVDSEIWQPWAFFRLGMYRTAARFEVDIDNPEALRRKLLPVVVSMAACGDHEKARNLVHAVRPDSLSDELWVAIAKNLSAYMPDASLEIIERTGLSISAIPYALILLRANRHEQAFALLDASMADRAEAAKPDILLLRLAAGGLSPECQLGILNAVLEKFELPKLTLLQTSEPVHPGNLRVANELPVEDSGPLVSIIMTAFNSGTRIRRAIESILAQTYRNIELIVVDDCSTDNTSDVIRDLAERDARVRLLVLSQNVGTYCAKTIGAKEAKGEFVTCMDSDDWSHPLKIETQIRPLLKDDMLVATASSSIRLCDDGVFDVTFTVSSKLIRLSYPSLLFRSDRVRSRAGLWDSAVRINADVEFLARLKLHFGPASVLVMPLPLSIMSRNESSLTGNSSVDGFGKQQFPPKRLDYVEAFNMWHLDCLKSASLPVISEDPLFWLMQHPFETPTEMRVDKERLASLAVRRG